MKKSILLPLTLAAAIGLAACSDKSQDAVANDVDNAAVDVNATMGEAIADVDAATDDALNSAENAADATGNAIENTADATGNALDAAGNSVRR